LVVFLPVLMIPVLAGGVTGGEAALKGLALVDTLFFALAAGLFQSASRQERLKAMRDSVLLVLGVVVLPLILGALFGKWGLSTPPAVVLLSPLGTLICAGDVVPQSSSGSYSSGLWSATVSYWISLAWVQALAWLLLIGAGVRLRRAVREESGAIPCQACHQEVSQSSENGDRQDACPTRTRRPPRWQQSADHASPVEWLVRRQRGIKAALWMAALLGIVYQLGWTAFAPFVGRPFFSSPLYFAVQVPALAFSMIGGALFAWAASRFFVEARRTGELELLLTTPLGARTVVSSQWTVLKRLLRWPVVVLLFPLVLRLIAAPFTGSYYSSGWLFPYAIIMLASLVNTVLSVGTVCWLGLWFGLKARGQGAAILWTVGLAKGVPFLIYTLSWSLISMFIIQLSGSPRSVYYGVVSLLTQVAILLFYVWLIRGVRRRLLRQLTEAEPMSFNLRQWFSDAKRDGAAAIRRARHWTPP
jgi:hypothetical protein